MAAFDQSTPFLLLARIHVKPGCVDQYLEIAQAADAAVKASEPGMIHHTFDRDPEDPQAFVWSGSMPTMMLFVRMCPILVQHYLQQHAELGDGFSVEVYGTVVDDCRSLMESLGLPLKIFETALGYSRVSASLFLRRDAYVAVIVVTMRVCLFAFVS